MNLPELPLLKKACLLALQWLDQWYWQVQAHRLTLTREKFEFAVKKYAQHSRFSKHSTILKV